MLIRHKLGTFEVLCFCQSFCVHRYQERLPSGLARIVLVGEGTSGAKGFHAGGSEVAAPGRWKMFPKVYRKKQRKSIDFEKNFMISSNLG